MRISKLVVMKTKPSKMIIRDIDFNLKGLSLIVDNTADISSESGNSVGKTTVIKIIDLCLGAKSVRSLYYDEDTQTENLEIKDFLIQHKVQAILVLIDSNSNKTIIKRDLFPKGYKYIENTPLPESDFWNELKRIIFKSDDRLPTFRQLIPKFVRVSNTSEDSMIRYLPKMVTKDTYDAVYSFLFNFLEKDLVSIKNDLSTQLADCQKTINMLERTQNSISVLRQQEELIEKDLLSHIESRNKLSYMESYKEELENKRKITTKITEKEKVLQLLDYEVKTIKDSLEKLKSEISNINLKIIQQIYNEAKMFLPELHKSYEELVIFHNKMIQNRIDFIAKQLDEKQLALDNTSKEINELLNEKKNITIDILDEGLLDELNVLNKKIEELSVRKGEISHSINLLEKHEKIKEDLLAKINDIEKNSSVNDIEEKLKVFNKIFSEYCEKLYSEKYLLGYNKNWKQENKFPLTIASLGGKLGTGKKKAVIVAFDLAYMKYSQEIGISAPQFVIHDKLENTHINQLKTIVDICQDIDGQYIIPILRERIDKIETKYIESAKVLELSSDKKFFKV